MSTFTLPAWLDQDSSPLYCVGDSYCFGDLEGEVTEVGPDFLRIVDSHGKEYLEPL